MRKYGTLGIGPREFTNSKKLWEGRAQLSLFQHQSLQSSLTDLKTCMNPCSYIPMAVIMIFKRVFLCNTESMFVSQLYNNYEAYIFVLCCNEKIQVAACDIVYIGM